MPPALLARTSEQAALCWGRRATRLCPARWTSRAHCPSRVPRNRGQQAGDSGLQRRSEGPGRSVDPPLPEHGSPPTPACSSLLLPALPVTPAVPSPGPLRPSPSSRRARGQATGLVTSSTAELSTEWTLPSPTNPPHRPRPRDPGSALRPRLAGPCAPGSPRSPLTAALRPALPAATR